MGRSSVSIAFRILLAGAVSVVGMADTFAQHGGASQREQYGGQGHGGMPTYQRKAFDWNNGPDKKHGDFRFNQRPIFHRPQVPNVQSGWFTRPYPYHLDFYKMKYDGSYAPYFGNLYGPPQVVTAPPYYGPYYGDFGYGYPGGYNGAGGYGGVPWGQPGNPDVVNNEVPGQEPGPSGRPTAESTGEGLPTPE